MHLRFQNVNSAFRGVIQNVYNRLIITTKTESRNGPVLLVEEPMVVTYERPRERVLFNLTRDANPFFHLYEALWMLAGRNDVASLAYYAKQIESYSDDGETLNGAYGYRWRHAFNKPPASRTAGEFEGRDQLQVLIAHLKANSGSRRAVLQMWNVEDDLLQIETSRDVCCNLCVCFSIREAWFTAKDYEVPKYLDMTVFNRSNDMIWGCFGSDYVHFSFLQEYVAACVGVEVGIYNHVTNNLHAYTENNSGWKPMEWLADETPDYYGFADNDPNKTPLTLKMVSLVKDSTIFDQEVREFVAHNANGDSVTQYSTWSEPFLATVAQPMCHAFHMHKQRDYEAAMVWANKVEANDWRIVAKAWIQKRKCNWENSDRK